MADIRIKDLTTTASSTASDDFIAVDGTTNGTRKLNAFSPTFGGNATVTGTLTAGSGSHVFGNSANTAEIKAQRLTTDPSSVALQAVASHAIINFTGDTGYTWGRIGSAGNEILRIYHAGLTSITAVAGGGLAVGGGLNVSATTASTTTSSGALVVGNGTSGGLGVGGAASIGGPILVGTSSDVYVSRVGTGILDIRSASSPGTTARLDVTGTTSAGVGFRQSGARDWFISAESNELRVSCLTAASIFAFNSGTPVAMRDSTASTSTSSGALVVSGGVGVAGAIYAGGYASTASHARIGASGSVVALSAANNVDSGLPAAWNGNYGLGVYYSAASTNTILMGDGSAGTTIFATRTGSANTSRITIDNTNGNTTFAGAISIGNTVNTVSPTSPNRTITMVIGGTTYYLAAKTTND